MHGKNKVKNHWSKWPYPIFAFEGLKNPIWDSAITFCHMTSFLQIYIVTSQKMAEVLSKMHRGRPETLLSLRGQQGKIY